MISEALSIQQIRLSMTTVTVDSGPTATHPHSYHLCCGGCKVVQFEMDWCDHDYHYYYYFPPSGVISSGGYQAQAAEP